MARAAMARLVSSSDPARISAVASENAASRTPGLAAAPFSRAASGWHGVWGAALMTSLRATAACPSDSGLPERVRPKMRGRM